MKIERATKQYTIKAMMEMSSVMGKFYCNGDKVQCAWGGSSDENPLCYFMNTKNPNASVEDFDPKEFNRYLYTCNKKKYNIEEEIKKIKILEEIEII